jgi:ADP-ribose pyrophosphatase YjhB (NUDIX family)
MTTPVPVCPHCAAPSERPLVCERCGWRWHSNPYPAAGVVIERRGSAGEVEILLLRRAVEPGAGGWDLPAGFLEPHESSEEGAIREALEESGLAVSLVKLLGVYSSPPGNAVSAIYRARPVDPDATVTLDHESSEHAWVPRSSVPEWIPRMAFRAMAIAVDDWANDRLGEPRPA